MTNWTESAKQQADELFQKHEEALRNKIFSDVYASDSKHQYVDLVCEGGGMMGIALVGYTYILEKAGIRFRSLAGASAGAINALMLAAIEADAETFRKSDRLLEIMGEKNFFDFVDGNGNEGNRKAVRTIISKLIAGKRWGLLFSPVKLSRTFRNLLKMKGLNSGDAFKSWIKDILQEEGIETTEALKNRLNQLPDLKYRMYEENRMLENGDDYAQLKIISSDITTESRTIFPEQAGVYFDPEDNVNPAEFVRASMSIPLFFKPLIAESISPNLEVWQQLKNFSAADFKMEEGEPMIPEKVYFVDGGMMSNFPFDVLHRPTGQPKMPTFGVKLEVDYRSQEFAGLFGYIGAVVNASRHALDNLYNDKYAQEYKHLVKEIHIPEEISWIDFNMPPEHKIKLFMSGADCAIEFLSGFDWDTYKALRSTYSLNHEQNIVETTEIETDHSD